MLFPDGFAPNNESSGMASVSVLGCSTGRSCLAWVLNKPRGRETEAEAVSGFGVISAGF